MFILRQRNKILSSGTQTNKTKKIKIFKKYEIKFCLVARTDEGGAGEVLRTGENPIKFLPNQNLSKTNLKYLSRKIQTSETPSDCRLGKSGNCTCR